MMQMYKFELLKTDACKVKYFPGEGKDNLWGIHQTKSFDIAIMWRNIFNSLLFGFFFDIRLLLASNRQ